MSNCLPTSLQGASTDIDYRDVRQQARTHTVAFSVPLYPAITLAIANAIRRGTRLAQTHRYDITTVRIGIMNKERSSFPAFGISLPIPLYLWGLQQHWL